MEVIIYFTDFNLFDNLKFKTFNVELLLKALEAFVRSFRWSHPQCRDFHRRSSSSTAWRNLPLSPGLLSWPSAPASFLP